MDLLVLSLQIFIVFACLIAALMAVPVEQEQGAAPVVPKRKNTYSYTHKSTFGSRTTFGNSKPVRAGTVPEKDFHYSGGSSWGSGTRYAGKVSHSGGGSFGGMLFP